MVTCTKLRAALPTRARRPKGARASRRSWKSASRRGGDLVAAAPRFRFAPSGLLTPSWKGRDWCKLPRPVRPHFRPPQAIGQHHDLRTAHLSLRARPPAGAAQALRVHDARDLEEARHPPGWLLDHADWRVQ